jgi:adenine-specific DNA-methyltransferase
MAYLDYLFLYLASTSGRDIVSLSVRRYGDALDKFEPNDLNNALVPSQQVFDELSTREVAKAVHYTERTGKTPDWIDAFFERLKTPVVS